MENCCTADCPVVFVIRPEKVNVPPIAGVPLISPVLSKDIPCGRLPPAKDQVKGGVL
jgi:hypothetical protein